jgi:hypothetical protein
MIVVLKPKTYPFPNIGVGTKIRPNCGKEKGSLYQHGVEYY